ncbi:hypothetical protein CRUP_026672 [Coryphaenoides rupestris]|nr:hypothetical protein CRUP_026672 [Coryphaenoides rupestris]
MTSLSRSSSGLVQRRTEASRSAAADREKPSAGEDAAPSRGEEAEDAERGDSKEPRLTLMEEVLLLGLKDRELISGLSSADLGSVFSLRSAEDRPEIS